MKDAQSKPLVIVGEKDGVSVGSAYEDGAVKIKPGTPDEPMSLEVLDSTGDPTVQLSGNTGVSIKKHNVTRLKLSIPKKNGTRQDGAIEMFDQDNHPLLEIGEHSGVNIKDDEGEVRSTLRLGAIKLLDADLIDKVSMTEDGIQFKTGRNESIADGGQAGEPAITIASDGVMLNDGPNVTVALLRTGTVAIKDVEIKKGLNKEKMDMFTEKIRKKKERILNIDRLPEFKQAYADLEEVREERRETDDWRRDAYLTPQQEREQREKEEAIKDANPNVNPNVNVNPEPTPDPAKDEDEKDRRIPGR